MMTILHNINKSLVNKLTAIPYNVPGVERRGVSRGVVNKWLFRITQMNRSHKSRACHRFLSNNH